ncbi:MAG TPA: succinylglutamate desuccinylase/aspartoacylase family protein [Candidatus Dormibacteraeota bacterium]|nr:succinylglutamate desuccinylase/aspartoacylase family protein [Candidatus Dormibacteraeota bacterium]
MTPPPFRPDYEALAAAWRELAARGGLRLQSVPAGETELLRGTLGHPDAPLVAISAGVHGDEPAGPSALLELVHQGLPSQFSYVFWPCTNPTGYRAGTRHSAGGVDINRSYGDGVTPESAAVAATWPHRQPLLALDLHEDYEAPGFYCYERSNTVETMAERIVAGVEASGIPVQASFEGIDLGIPVDEAERRGLWRAGRGWIRALRYEPLGELGGRPFTVWSSERGVPLSFTFESPGRAAWEVRVRSLASAVRTALGLLSRP